ncbi:hypothetical protein D3C87_440890 [compost metagenome]
MRKLILIPLIALQTMLYSQEKVNLSHVIESGNFIEVSLELENKPNDKFHLIKIDTMTIITSTNEVLKDNADVQNIFRRANVLARYNLPSKDSKTVNIKGTLKYFTASSQNKSHFKIGKLGTIKKNTNLITSNSTLYFGIVDSLEIEKVFPDLKLRAGSKGQLEKVDYKTYDLMFAYKTSKTQDIIPLVNGDLEFGYNTLTLHDPKTKTIYKLVKLKKQMSQTERNDIEIELLIENENAVRKIPFEFKNVIIK